MAFIVTIWECETRDAGLPARLDCALRRVVTYELPEPAEILRVAAAPPKFAIALCCLSNPRLVAAGE